MTTIPYIPNTEQDKKAMLEAIGVASSAELFKDIPKNLRSPALALPPPLSEVELLAEMKDLARLNASGDDYACFLGAGAYRHFIPSIVRHIIGRSEFYTSYTPYQAEISQGILQATYEFQSLVCQLTGMDAANSGMYDGATAMAEAALMACRVTGRGGVALLDSINPTYRKVLETYAEPQDISLHTISRGESLPSQPACLIVQTPNFYGYVEELSSYVEAAHKAGALLVAVVDPISLGLFKPPGEYGADIVVGEGQTLGNALNFGGPYLGLFACRSQYLRQMPGRIVGKTVDTHDRPGYVLTLQTREQHIRRERATSNICTSETLVAIAAAVYLAALGKHGFRQVAELCYHKAHYAASRIAGLKGYSLPVKGVFFKEFAVACPKPVSQVNSYLQERKIIGGLDISHLLPNTMLLCATEMNPKAQIDALVDALAEIGGK